MINYHKTSCLLGQISIGLHWLIINQLQLAYLTYSSIHLLITLSYYHNVSLIILTLMVFKVRLFYTCCLKSNHTHINLTSSHWWLIVKLLLVVLTILHLHNLETRLVYFDIFDNDKFICLTSYYLYVDTNFWLRTGKSLTTLFDNSPSDARHVQY